MQTSEQRILTTHAGALPRPAELMQQMGGGAGAERPRQPGPEAVPLLERSVQEVVEQQVQIGIDVVNDGEYGKPSWTGYINERLGGFEVRPIPDAAPGVSRLLNISKDMRQFSDYYREAMERGTLWYRASEQEGAPPPPVQYVATAPIEYIGQEVLQRDIDHFKRALEATPAHDAFLPVAAPASVEVGRYNEYYASEEEFVFALAEAMREEYRMIVDAGFVVQIDDAYIPALWDLMDTDRETYLKYCNLRVEALNHALEDIPSSMVRYHLCWGSWHGPHTNDIPLADIVGLMLKVNADAYVIEAANVRHEHEYRVWDEVALPEGKSLIPGVVSHATNVVEHPDLVAERLVRFADRVGRERVMAGTDCGLGGRVHPQIAWAKLEALVEGSRRASAQLWK